MINTIYKCKLPRIRCLCDCWYFTCNNPFDDDPILDCINCGLQTYKDPEEKNYENFKADINVIKVLYNPADKVFKR